MKPSTVVIASAGWLVACTACAQKTVAVLDENAVLPGADPADLRYVSSERDENASDAHAFEENAAVDDGILLASKPVDSHANNVPLDPLTDIALSDSSFGGKDVSYSLSFGKHRTVYARVGAPADVSLGPPVSYLAGVDGIDLPDAGRLSHWLDPGAVGARAFSVGYAWRGIKLEGFASAGPRENDGKPPKKDILHLDSRTTRLSFRPADNWVLQLSRGTLVGLDQVVPSGDARRSAISASYRRAFDGGDWQTTLAWGRTARKYREATTGYLLESALRFKLAHTVFGRLEQVGSDDLLRENDSPQRMFKMNKLTLGYYKDVQTNGPLRFDAGALVSKHFIPSAIAPTYGREPVSYMLFVRLKFQ